MLTLNADVRLIDSIAGLYEGIKQKNRIFESNLMVLAVLIGNKPFRIVLADDDEDDRELFSDAIKNIAPQVKVETAKDGVKLMNRLKQAYNDLPDLIFLDLNMPLKSGMECLEELRADDKLKHLPIVIYSTSATKSMIDNSYKKGANLYAKKPDSFSGIQKMLAHILNREVDAFFPQPDKDNFFVSCND